MESKEQIFMKTVFFTKLKKELSIILDVAITSIDLHIAYLSDTKDLNNISDVNGKSIDLRPRNEDFINNDYIEYTEGIDDYENENNVYDYEDYTTFINGNFMLEAITSLLRKLPNDEFELYLNVNINGIDEYEEKELFLLSVLERVKDTHNEIIIYKYLATLKKMETI